MQSILHAVFPPECLHCATRVGTDFALCGACWGETPFIHGAICDTCGCPLPGDDEDGRLRCDDCLSIARPWDKGRAALLYSSIGRKLVLGLKHGDRADIARAAGPWLARAAADLLEGAPLLLPVPLHHTRLLRRKYNQSALLAHSMAQATGLTCLPDALLRRKITRSQDGLNRDQRFDNLSGSITANPKRAADLKGRRLLIIDDVMTSGATFSAATQAAQSAGAGPISVIALARVLKDA